MHANHETSLVSGFINLWSLGTLYNALRLLATTARGRSPIGRGKALKPPPVRVRVPPPLRGAFFDVSFFSSVAPVAKSATGRWVSRVGASGGGKAYKKTRPGNFYGALAVIVVLGLVATVFARYEYQHPTKKPDRKSTRLNSSHLGI